MAIQIETGVDWFEVVSRIENLPRGEAREVSFIGNGKRMLVEHRNDGTVRLRIDGDGDARWIYPPNLKTVADILRLGLKRRVQA